MPIRYQRRIYRNDLKLRPTWYYLFGDNMAEEGYGGQAKEMRGEANAIGVPTKHAPSMAEHAFFTDGAKCTANVQARWASIFARVESLLDSGAIVVIPTDGLGTGLSQLPQRAPRLYRCLTNKIAEWETRYGRIP